MSSPIFCSSSQANTHHTRSLPLALRLSVCLYLSLFRVLNRRIHFIRVSGSSVVESFLRLPTPAPHCGVAATPLILAVVLLDEECLVGLLDQVEAALL